MWVGALGSETPECKSYGNRADFAGFFVQRSQPITKENGSLHLGGTATCQQQVNKACQWCKKIWARLSALNPVFEMSGSHAIRSDRGNDRTAFRTSDSSTDKRVDTDGSGKDACVDEACGCFSCNFPTFSSHGAAKVSSEQRSLIAALILPSSNLEVIAWDNKVVGGAAWRIELDDLGNVQLVGTNSDYITLHCIIDY